MGARHCEFHLDGSQTFFIFLQIFSGFVTRQSKITWQQLDPFESSIYECSVNSPLLRQDRPQYSTHYSTNSESFPVWLVRTDTISCTNMNKKHCFFPWPQEVSSYVHMNRYPAKHSADLRFSLYAALFTDTLSANSSCFCFFSLSFIPSSQLRQFIGLHLGTFPQHSSDKIFCHF